MDLFHFSGKQDVALWHTENDDVMGGVSQSKIIFLPKVDGEAGVMSFEGTISLENDGGFAQILYTDRVLDFSAYDYLTLRVKGDHKQYQIRLETDAANVGYSHSFLTHDSWETITLPLRDFTADHHGEPVPNAPELNRKKIHSFGILIGNGKAESFRLLLKHITVE